MTPLDPLSAKLAFTLAAKKDDHAEMLRLLSRTPEHMSPLDKGVLFFAFNEALMDKRFETAEFILRETPLQKIVGSDLIAMQANYHGLKITPPAKTS